ncbi:MAG: antibiotic biosynthesis monooxygenase [Pirellulales bacterium]|nr:antibiotic biosynthesis monooxygenase [Pirellulales bacterium]
MVHLNVLLLVRDPANASRVRDLLREAGRISRREPGCLRFEVYHSQADPRRFVLCEYWESQAALDVHRQGRAFTEIYSPQVLPLVEREPHPSELVE